MAVIFIMDILRKKSMLILCLMSFLLCTSCGGGSKSSNETQNDSSTESNAETEQSQDLVLHCEKEKTAYFGMSEKKYILEYKITLHVDGTAEIYVSPTKFIDASGNLCNKDDEINVQGSWTLGHKKRGANFVDYYDIVFTENYDDHNWCVDQDFKTLYFNWDAFRTNDREKAIDIKTVEKI